ncbi:hypothetical protein DFH09DRAFT_407069 [Mycena vulgaris]|nr:hypothetical protein DFH09DRAFT_407069 [Mycena vulgaris]
MILPPLLPTYYSNLRSCRRQLRLHRNVRRPRPPPSLDTANRMTLAGRAWSACARMPRRTSGQVQAVSSRRVQSDRDGGGPCLPGISVGFWHVHTAPSLRPHVLILHLLPSLRQPALFHRFLDGRQHITLRIVLRFSLPEFNNLALYHRSPKSCPRPPLFPHHRKPLLRAALSRPIRTSSSLKTPSQNSGLLC